MVSSLARAISYTAVQARIFDFNTLIFSSQLVGALNLLKHSIHWWIEPNGKFCSTSRYDRGAFNDYR